MNDQATPDTYIRYHDFIGPALAIEKAVNQIEPWSEKTFERAFAGNIVRHSITLDPHGRLTGYIFYTFRPKSRRIVVENLAVAPWARRQNHGTNLVLPIKKHMGPHYEKIALYVPEQSLETHLFLRAMGFLATDIVRGFFDVPRGRDPHDGDAILFEHEAVATLAGVRNFARRAEGNRVQ
jgi:ribosomal protein S18 acetylase RimI-like enzyme